MFENRILLFLFVLMTLFMWTKPAQAKSYHCHITSNSWFEENPLADCRIVMKKKIRHVHHRTRHHFSAMSSPRPAKAYGASSPSEGDIYQAVHGTVVEGLWREYEAWRVKQQVPSP